MDPVLGEEFPRTYSSTTVSVIRCSTQPLLVAVLTLLGVTLIPSNILTAAPSLDEFVADSLGNYTKSLVVGSAGDESLVQFSCNSADERLRVIFSNDLDTGAFLGVGVFDENRDHGFISNNIQRGNYL